MPIAVAARPSPILRAGGERYGPRSWRGPGVREGRAGRTAAMTVILMLALHMQIPSTRRHRLSVAKAIPSRQ